MVQQAMGVTGYVIQAKGYASKVGSAASNQRLSTERAENVTNFLEQQGKIPLTNMLAPGPMGTSQQVAPHTTGKGRRRTGERWCRYCRTRRSPGRSALPQWVLGIYEAAQAGTR